MTPRFDPTDKSFKSCVGGAPIGEQTEFTVIADAEDVVLRIRPDNGEYTEFCMKKDGKRFVFTYRPTSAGLFFYAFLIDGVGFGMPDGGYASPTFGTLEEGGGEFQLTVYKPYKTPDWIKGGVIYQIFPDRFNRSGETQPREEQRLRSDWGGVPDYLPVNGKILNDDFFGGNFKGIEKKLDYIKKLNVNTVYLNPIFRSRSNHRYDTGDYMQPDELLGSEDDLKELIESAKKKGIRIILDGVFNHTGDDSVYFNKYGRYPSKGAYNAKNSRFRDWYNFISYPNNYECWWGIDTLPQINESNGEYRKFICGDGGVVKKYLNMGIGGWRLDVVDELPDDFVKELNKSIKQADPDAVIVGEVWENVTDKIAYGVRREYFLGDEIDSAMNYPLKNAIINYVLTERTDQLAEVMRRQKDCYPAQSLHVMMNILGTHDTPRIINVLSGAEYPMGRQAQASAELNREQYEKGVERLKFASAILYTCCGVPTIYYGDERGMTGWSDPFNRGCMNWQAKSELTAWFTRLGEIRNRCSQLTNGEMEIEYLSKTAIVYSRGDGKNKLYIAANLGPHTLQLCFSGCAVDLLSDEDGKEFFVPYGSVRIIEEEA